MKLFVSFKIKALLLISLLAFQVLGQISQPCTCLCGGQHRCPPGYSACCWCDDAGKCFGSCIGKQANAQSFAAKIASVIEGKTVTVNDLIQNQKEYEDLFTKLMKGQIEETKVYRIEHEGRTINFVLTKRGTDQINVVTRELKTNRDFGAAEAAKPSIRKTTQSKKP